LSIADFDALPSTIVRRAKRVMLDKPGDPSGELFDFALRRGDPKRETILKLARNHALDPAKLVDIGDDVIANAARIAALNGDATSRQIDRHAGALEAVREQASTRQHEFGAFQLATPFEC
jgi:hypothetical protein